MMCFQGPLISYALVTPEVLLVTQMLNFSQFFTHFSVGLPRICLCANVRNFEYWHLFIACKNWLCGNETWMRAIFSWMKNTLFCSQFSPWNTGNGILGLWNSKMLWGSTPPLPGPPPLPPHPRKRGLMASCWYSRLLYSNCWLLQLLSKALYSSRWVLKEYVVLWCVIPLAHRLNIYFTV